MPPPFENDGVDDDGPVEPPWERLRRIVAFLDMICREEEGSDDVVDAVIVSGDALVLLLVPPCFITIILRLIRHSVADAADDGSVLFVSNGKIMYQLMSGPAITTLSNVQQSR